MTLPYERTRAILKTEAFLRELSRDEDLPQGIRRSAKSLLRHYLSAAQVFSLGRLEECLVNEAPEDEYRRRVIAFHQPLLCSSLESGARPSSYDTGSNDPAIKHHQTGPS